MIREKSLESALKRTSRTPVLNNKKENNMNIATIIIYIVFLGGMFYFMLIKPQKKERKRQEEMYASMAIGDYIVTTSGFYGQIIDITNDMVIVEFGNKNCRIPMVRSAIARIEKADALKNGMSGTETGDAEAVAKSVQKDIEA